MRHGIAIPALLGLLALAAAWLLTASPGGYASPPPSEEAAPEEAFARPPDPPEMAAPDPEAMSPVPADTPEEAAGKAALCLRLVDRETGSLTAMKARLWRLGVPMDEEWTAGDLVQAEIEVPEEGLTIEGLPEGRYRLECADQAKGAEDPPEFWVGSEADEMVVEVVLPKPFDLRLLVFDEQDLVVGRALLDDRGRNSRRRRTTAAPPWANPRRRRGGQGARTGLTLGVG